MVRIHWLRIIPVLIAVALVQVTLVPAFSIRGARPDLLLLVAVCIVAREPIETASRWDAFWTGWIAGLLVDVYAVGGYVPFGSTALVFGAMAAVVSRVGADLFLDSAIAQAIILLVVALVVNTVLAVLVRVFAGGLTRGLLAQGAWSAVYSALAAPFVFGAMRPFSRLLGLRARRSFGGA